MAKRGRKYREAIEAYDKREARNFEEAIPIYKQYIETHLEEQLEIDGLGNNEISVGYYEWVIPEWYRDGIATG